MKKVLFYSIYLVCILLLASCSRTNHMQPELEMKKYPSPTDKMIFMVIEPWYGNPSTWPSGDWCHWSWNSHYPGDSDFLFLHGYRDIAASYYPLIGAYDSFDLVVINWQIDISKAMLADCIMIDYYGYGISPSSTYYQAYKIVTDKIIQEAANKSIKTVLLYETQVQKFAGDKISAIANDLQAILDNAAWINSGTYFHIDGKPVICIFEPVSYGLTSNDWHSIKSQIGDCCLISYSSDITNSFYGCFAWNLYGASIKSNVTPKPFNTIKAFADCNNNAASSWAMKANGRVSISVIWPGFNDSKVMWDISSPRITDYVTAEGTAFYDATIQSALELKNQNKWVVVATLNDWNESTSVEPSLEKGYLYAIKTKKFAEEFKEIPFNQRQPDSIFQTITGNLTNYFKGIYK